MRTVVCVASRTTAAEARERARDRPRWTVCVSACTGDEIYVEILVCVSVVVSKSRMWYVVLACYGDRCAMLVNNVTGDLHHKPTCSLRYSGTGLQHEHKSKISTSPRSNKRSILPLPSDSMLHMIVIVILACVGSSTEAATAQKINIKSTYVQYRDSTGKPFPAKRKLGHPRSFQRSASMVMLYTNLVLACGMARLVAECPRGRWGDHKSLSSFSVCALVRCVPS